MCAGIAFIPEPPTNCQVLKFHFENGGGGPGGGGGGGFLFSNNRLYLICFQRVSITSIVTMSVATTEERRSLQK